MLDDVIALVENVTRRRDTKSASAVRRDPKSLSGSRKPPLHLIPPVANIAEAMVLKSGAAEYGVFNWRTQSIEAMEHIGAVERHIARWKDGESRDPKTGQHPLAHARATLGILLDALDCGTLIDDRPPRPKRGGAARAIAKHTIRKRRTT